MAQSDRIRLLEARVLALEAVLGALVRQLARGEQVRLSEAALQLNDHYGAPVPPARDSDIPSAVGGFIAWLTDQPGGVLFAEED